MGKRAKVRGVRRAPKRWPCPTCGALGTRFAFRHREAVDAALGRPAILRVKVGLYKAQCSCRRVFESFHPELPKGRRFSRTVRELVVRAVVRDKLSVQDVRQRLREDFLVEVSEGCVHNWLAEAGGKNRPCA
jgi:hypothetical protein